MLVAVGCALAACSTSGRSFDTTAIGQIIPGQTTLEQAATILRAEPENIYRQRDGAAMARWAHKTSVLTDAVYFRRELWLQFDQNGRFQHVVNRVNVISDPGPAPQETQTHTGSNPTAAASAFDPVSAGANCQDDLNAGLPCTVPPGFPYQSNVSTDATRVYPVR